MDLSELIKARRSIRSFDSNKPVTKKFMERILESAIWAPSGGNVQPWRFFVVSNGKRKKGLCEAAYGQEYILEAPYSIVICIDKPRARAKYDERGLNLYAIQDTSAAAQNILLTAPSFGLGPCWIGAFDENKV